MLQSLGQEDQEGLQSLGLEMLQSLGQEDQEGLQSLGLEVHHRTDLEVQEGRQILVGPEDFQNLVEEHSLLEVELVGHGQADSQQQV